MALMFVATTLAIHAAPPSQIPPLPPRAIAETLSETTQQSLEKSLEHALEKNAAAASGVQFTGRERLENFFRHPRTEIATLSPDGKYLAYSYRHNTDLYVFVAHAAAPGRILTRRVALNDADAGTYSFQGLVAPNRAQIIWMAWFPPNRLVLETNRIIATYHERGFGYEEGVVITMDAHGIRGRLLATPNNTKPFIIPPTRLNILVSCNIHNFG